MAEMQRNRDLVLPPRTQAFVLDTTKGKISTYVGPSKTSLSDTDQLVVWDRRQRQFVPCPDSNKAVINWAEAAEGQYVVLLDPAKDSSKPHPAAGTSLEAIELDVGRKEVIPGPVTFPLWAGQTAETIDGHRMATNQFIVVRVSQPEDAKKNWEHDIVYEVIKAVDDVDLDMGRLMIIKGTDVSFYIPQTGFEVVGDKDGNYVRNAVTLEQLEYCILLDENGKKRYVHGPDVVFPEPTEVFVTHDNKRKYQAIELSPQSGIYVKVTTAYEEYGKQYNVGDELFITGNETPFYFPRAEHSVIKYGDQIKHHAIAIPEGEGRYVLNRNTGDVRLVKGAKMYLPNPIDEVIVRRVLDPETVKVMYPGNVEAARVNELYNELAETHSSFLNQHSSFLNQIGSSMSFSASTASRHEANYLNEQVSTGFGDKTQNRGTSYSAPRTITLDTKYEGAVAVNVWAGYAVCIADKKGNRRVELGPKTILLEYDESLMVLELSTGSPKKHDKLLKTCYLRVINNTVTDVVSVETSDFVPVNIALSYTVNFVANSENAEYARAEENSWFEIENYVKVLTEHCRSRLRSIAKQHSIKSFYGQETKIIRDALLGVKVDGEDRRRGLLFESNCMLLADVDILHAKIEDDAVAQLFARTTFETLQGIVSVSHEQAKAQQIATIEDLKRRTFGEYDATSKVEHDVAIGRVARAHLIDLKRLDNQLATKAAEEKIAENVREINKANADYEIAIVENRNAVDIDFMKAEIELKVQLMNAITPNMIASLEAFGDKNFVANLSQALAPAALAAGITTADLLARIFDKTPFGDVLEKLTQRNPALLGSDSDHI